MKNKKFILFVLALIQIINAFGQRIQFTYDENGNRTRRSLVIQQLQSESTSFPVLNPKSTTPLTSAKAVASDNNQENLSKSEEALVVAKVYPNPNKGLIKIDIQDLPLISQNELRLYDVSGNELIVQKNIGSYTELDLNKLRKGIYILRIKINDKVFDYKVIKN